jgi:hypothetical protein
VAFGLLNIKKLEKKLEKPRGCRHDVGITWWFVEN